MIQKASTKMLRVFRLQGWSGEDSFLEEGKRVHREFIASSYACPTSVSTSAERGERERERPLMQMPDLHRICVVRLPPRFSHSEPYFPQLLIFVLNLTSPFKQFITRSNKHSYNNDCSQLLRTMLIISSKLFNLERSHR